MRRDRRPSLAGCAAENAGAPGKRDVVGMCCEMEGAAIAQACYLDGVPFVVMRAISDKPGGTELADYQAFEAQAAAHCAAIVRRMVKSAE